MGSVATTTAPDPVTAQWIRCKADEIAASKGYFFHPPSGDRVIQFVSVVCKTTLQPWQADLIMRLFGWRRPDGRRRFTRGYISMAKKNGKTFLSSIIATYILICEQGDVVSAANSRNQASQVFGDLHQFINRSAALKKITKVIPSTKTAFVTATRASYKAMSADVATGDGVRAKLAIYDEYHRAKDSALYDILQPAGTGQSEPLFLIATTSGESLVSPCGNLYEYAKKVAAGNIEDDAELGFFSAIYESAEDDNPALEATWLKANPSLGFSMELEKFRGDYLEAAQSPTRLATFRRLRLNQWVSADTEGAWLDQDAWASSADESITLDMLKGRECYGGLDLSSTRDITALVLVFKLDDGRYYLMPFFWIPGAQMQRREKRDGCPYYAWAQVPENNIQITEGNVQDYAALRQRVNELKEIYDIREMAIDRWNAQKLINEMTDDGLDMVPFGQGFGSMNGPTKELERLHLSTPAGMAHGNNPLLNHMAGKCVVETDAAGNIKPSKRKSTHRIDGIVAGIMGLGRALQAGEPMTESLVA
jgi:phage terminase large subunit-like protein